jgi:hypothetical protein
VLEFIYVSPIANTVEINYKLRNHDSIGPESILNETWLILTRISDDYLMCGLDQQKTSYLSRDKVNGEEL